jgi:cell division protease FtsH
VLVDRPDVRGREAILKVHARNLRLSADVDLNQVARITPGFAGADLALVLNEAALLAARQDKTEITPSDVEAAVERIVVGLEKKSRRLSEKVKRVVAYHEAGHAICAAAFPGSAPVQKVSIIPRGIGALGYTLKTPTEDRYLVTRTELLNELVTLYGGRTAEELVFGEITTGASDDIRKASDIARNMIAQYGMSEKMGLIDYQGGRSNPFGIGGGPMRDVSISEDTARRLDEETHRLLEAAWRRSRKVLTTHRELLDRMANALLEKESLDRDEIKAFLDEVELSPLTEEQLRAPA